MSKLAGWLTRRADNVAVALLTVMFVSFLLQIFSRYVVRQPLGWTIELCLMCWLWLVFWGCAFLVSDRDHVTFDIFYLAAPNRLRRVLALISALVLLVSIAASLPASLDYINFMQIKKSALMRIRLDAVFSVYAIFAVALIVRYGARIIALLRGTWSDGRADKEQV